MSAPWIPTFVYGSGPTTLALTLPMRPWRYDGPTEGVHRWSASLQFVSATVNRHRDLVLTLRLLESEVPSVTSMLTTLQDAITSEFTVTLDTAQVEVASSSYECLLVHPQAGENVGSVFRRSGEYPAAFEAEITVRKLDDTAWDIEWIPGSGESA